MTTQREAILRRCRPERLATLTESARARALGSIMELNDQDEHAIGDVLADLAADCLGITLAAACGLTDEEVLAMDRDLLRAGGPE